MSDYSKLADALKKRDSQTTQTKQSVPLSQPVVSPPVRVAEVTSVAPVVPVHLNLVDVLSRPYGVVRRPEEDTEVASVQERQR